MKDQSGFKAWMAKVDAAIEARIGMSSMDLPDICYNDMYQDGAKPGTAANAAIRAASE